MASLVNLSICDRVAQIAAPDRKKARESAFSPGGQQGWYSLFSPHSPLISLALRYGSEKDRSRVVLSCLEARKPLQAT